MNFIAGLFVKVYMTPQNSRLSPVNQAVPNVQPWNSLFLRLSTMMMWIMMMFQTYFINL